MICRCAFPILLHESDADHSVQDDESYMACETSGTRPARTTYWFRLLASFEGAFVYWKEWFAFFRHGLL
jgi:hypothetical protein